MLSEIQKDAFLILCPDNDTPRRLDERRIQWNTDDLIKEACAIEVAPRLCPRVRGPLLSAPTNGRNHDFFVHRRPNRERNGTMNELDHFRDEVQTFLAEHLTAELQRAGRLEAGIYAERPSLRLG